MRCASDSLNISNDFARFFFEVFSVAVKRVEGRFIPSRHFAEWATLLQAFPKTSVISARKHIKTTLALGYLAWRLYRINRRYEEWEFMGYLEDLAQYHLKRLKRYIQAVPEFFGDCADMTKAESIIHYIKNGMEFICTPSGILSFKRGRHPHGMILDDILKDPEKKLDVSQLKKIERIFLEEIESMPQEEIHLFGTPQDRNDLFAKIETMTEYVSRRYPAIASDAEKSVLWPEAFPYERLVSIRNNIGQKAFNKEYLCRPVRGEEGFLKEAELDRIIRTRLRNYPVVMDEGTAAKLRLRELSFGGFDIGKKSHPSHLAVFGVNRKRRLVQLHSKWMDGWDYNLQRDYLSYAIQKFGMGKLLYDDTRAEFEAFKERGELPEEMEGLSFTAKNKYTMATQFDAFVTSDNILLLNDERQKRQLLNVDNDLKAVQTEEGHGDCFFSICLAIKAYQEGAGAMAWDLE